jgi:hypothetical protein
MQSPLLEMGESGSVQPERARVHRGSQLAKGLIEHFFKPNFFFSLPGGLSSL